MKSLLVLIKHRTTPSGLLSYSITFVMKTPSTLVYHTISMRLRFPPPVSTFTPSLQTLVKQSLRPLGIQWTPLSTGYLPVYRHVLIRLVPFLKGLHFGLWQNVYPISSPLEILLPSESRCEGYQRHQADDPPLYGPSYLARRPKTLPPMP